MTFAVAAEAYDRFMGRYSIQLAPQMADLAGVASGQRVVDVGCGPGALTGELVRRVGAASVSAVDPSASFVDAACARYAGVDVRRATAEALPFTDTTFDAALAQLVVHFMKDPVRGIAEMRRVTKSGGAVVACVWDHLGGGPVTVFWRAARALDPAVDDESDLPGVREGDLPAIFERAGLRDVRSDTVTASLEHASFAEWWEPFELGVGPAGGYLARLDAARRAALRERCRASLPEGPFVVTARAWAARGTV